MRGELPPGWLLTLNAIKERTGIGREQLMVARKSGIVKAYPCGGTHFYKSEEIMEWILSGGGDTKAARRRTEANS